MKQIITFILFFSLCFFHVDVFAQNGLILGVRGGISLTKNKYTGDLHSPDATMGRILRYQGGPEVGYQRGSFALTVGGRYVMKGGVEKDNRDDPEGNSWVTPDGIIDYGEQKITTKFNFFSVPLLVRYRYGQGAVRVGLSVGPQFNIGVGKLTETVEENFFNTGLRVFEDTYGYGITGDAVLKKTNLSFLFMPEVSFTVSPYGVFRGCLLMERSGDMLNESFLWGDADGSIRKIRGSFKSGGVALEIGYEHRINIQTGVKY